MPEKKTKTTLERIEQLILDGNKEVVERIEKRLDETKQELRQEIQDVKFSLNEKMDKLDKKHDVNATAAYELLTDVRKEVGDVSQKLDAHIRVQHAV